MSPSEIEELARQPMEPAAALDARMTELRSKGARILDCIRYVRLNQGCSLAQAGDLVAGLDVLLDESLPPRGEQLHVGREVWEEMQAVLPVVEKEIEEADEE